MVGKDIYTNCGTVGQTEWPDGEARRSDEGGPRYPMGEQGRRTSGWVPNGGWTGARRRGTGARRRPGVARRRAGCVPDGGRGLGGWPNGGSRGGPTGDYIRAGGPPFWALSSCAQSHLQEMWERRVLMSESGPFRGEFRKECSPPHCFYN
jgi:hypothetical protein